MSISKQTTIWCDGHNCGEWDQASEPADILRRQLRSIGWKVSQPGGKDYCPKCAESGVG